MKMTLTDKTVMILGGTGGIGKAVAIASLKDGANIIIVSKSPQNNSKTVKELSEQFPSQKVTGALVDTLELAKDESLYEAAVPNVRVDHLVVASTPGLIMGAIEDISLENAHDCTNNFLGQFIFVKQALKRGQIPSNGSIVLTSGTTIYRPQKHWTIVTAMGSAVTGFAKALAVEIAPIRVNTIVPGLLDTNLWKEGREQIRALGDTLPLKHIGTPEEIAETYLTVMKNTFMTASEIMMDGGGTM
ncbi:hypothetical protein V1511DRAFT_502464 [Dipodascopsis uninucleata]